MLAEPIYAGKQMESTSTCVIGSGIMGASTAYHVAQLGHPVRLVEAKGLLTGGTASQACAGGVRFGPYPV
jgi:glycine/D-amino acid oxidase-like deaminating enzyme